MERRPAVGWKLQTPVAFLIFNRPHTAARVFEAIRQAQPPVLLVVADGPRAGRPSDAELCRTTRAIVEQVDWPCQVLKEYADVNLGSRRRISSGLDWVFRTVEEAIILEDDCLPHPSFFRFCQELLAYYRDDERIMHISGDNFQRGRTSGEGSYYFSRYPHAWGWASWRRAWAHFDVSLRQWSAAQDKDALLEIFGTSGERRFWRMAWDGAATGKIDAWDYQWAFTCIAQDALCIMPNTNLVANIGMGPDATHTKDKNNRFANLPTHAMGFPLVHPTVVRRNAGVDEEARRAFFTLPHPLRIALSRIYRRLRPSR